MLKTGIIIFIMNKKRIRFMTCGFLASWKFEPRNWFIYSYENIEKFIRVNGMKYWYV